MKKSSKVSKTVPVDNNDDDTMSCVTLPTNNLSPMLARGVGGRGTSGSMIADVAGDVNNDAKVAIISGVESGLRNLINALEQASTNHSCAKAFKICIVTNLYIIKIEQGNDESRLQKILGCIHDIGKHYGRESKPFANSGDTVESSVGANVRTAGEQIIGISRQALVALQAAITFGIQVHDLVGVHDAVSDQGPRRNTPAGPRNASVEVPSSGQNDEASELTPESRQPILLGQTPEESRALERRRDCWCTLM